jgi:hypothetical protein
MNETMWEPPKVSKGMLDGRNKNLNDINKFVKPKLNEIGLDLVPLAGTQAVRENFPLAKYKFWSTLQMRFEKDGSGNIHKIFSVEDTTRNIISQIFVLQSASIKALGIRANFNIPHNIMEITNEYDRIMKMLEILEGLELYLYLHIKPSLYVLIKYSDIPIDGWVLTYRKRSNRKNRMYVKSSYLEKHYKHYSIFEKDIKGKL